MSKKNYRVSSAIANLKFLASSLCLPIIFVLCIFSAIDSGTPARADELNQVLEEYWLAQNTAPFQPLPPLPQPTPVPLPQQPPEEPLKIPPTRSPQTPETVSETIVVTDFEFTGNTVFSAEELGKIKILGTEETIGSIENEAYSFSQLLQIASQVADFYAQKGYRTSGAVISIPQETQRQKKGIVTIQVIEGKLEAIQVREIDSKMRRRLDSYVEARLGAEIGKPLNVDRTLEALQLLQLDPVIESISARLAAGSQQGSSILEVDYLEADTFNAFINLNNARSPNVGSFQREVGINTTNLTGLADSLRLSYINTDGSDALNIGYEVTLTSSNGTLRFDFLLNDNRVIEPPLDDINEDGNEPDITSEFSSYELTYRQPIIRSIDEQTFREFALGFSASFRDNQVLLFDEFPLSLSADEEGRTKVFALRFSQDYTKQSADEVFALRSQFSVGLGGVLGSTIKSEIPGVDEIPDSRFFAWRGQGQYVRLLDTDMVFVLQSNIQIADRGLVPIEQFALGGVGSVMGYRQNLVLTDNGFFAGAEVRLPVLRVPEWQAVLQVIPFVNYGIGWNTNIDTPDPNDLASVGVGLLWRQGDDLNIRLDWGIPLMDVEGEKRTWQENGFYFTIQYNFL
ncbi:MAG: ShlB/FhaC/HecB family hemolysin secretion/activation protein [Hydrococcus sp. RU_2_2]|nr:ShlB/FhaC/HecB family hemolysin secretion/activation protein [Hydrococcus sp. RU_2_2]NJP19254.1 ShlB/FhaC/HecB family hemolysin secretion/activation protein [Hydrococcus sp. CRU_1_1]